MKYLKTYEQTDEELNKIYTYYNKYGNEKYEYTKYIGKMKSDFNGGTLFIGYVVDQKSLELKKHSFIIRREDWKFIKDAKPEEIELYEYMEDVNKYNL